MPTQQSLASRMEIRSIFWPIFVEQLLLMSLMAADVFMLSQYSDDAVAAVGLSSQLLLFITLSYMIVSAGSAIMMGQCLGAGEDADSWRYAHAGFFLSLMLALVVGMLFFLCSDLIIGAYNLEPNVHRFAFQYISITGSLSVATSVNILLSTILRTQGHPRSPMFVQMLGGLINITGNYIALFGPMGLPVTGVSGVAAATVISQATMVMASLYTLKYHKLPFSVKLAFRVEWNKLRRILKLGLPNAGEGISYNVSQIILTFFISQLGTAALAAAAITMSLARFIFVFSLSLGTCSQILSSFYVGQARFSELKRNVHHYWLTGTAVSFFIALLLYLVAPHLSSLFSDDENIKTLISTLLLVSLFLEPCRSVNLIVISALKGAGDVIFPVKIGVLSMWGIGVTGAYLIGIHWAWGVAGIWFASGLDECIRACTMIIRWQREKWVSKSQVTKNIQR